MTTYNHQDYIEKAINSVLNQVTNFSFRLIISDDFSNDNTLFICKKYANLYPTKVMLIQSVRNVGIIRNYLTCFELCDSKYIAILEGDDYWIDNLKLQKQYDVLEKKKQVGLVFSNYKIFNQQTKDYTSVKKKLQIYSSWPSSNTFKSLIFFNHICAATVVFRRNLINDIDTDFLLNNNLKTLDFYLWLHISYKNQLYYVNEITTVYRVSNNSISNSNHLNKSLDFLDTTFRIANYFISKYSKDLNLNILLEEDRVVKKFFILLKFHKINESIKLLTSLRIRSLYSYILRRNRFK